MALFTIGISIRQKFLFAFRVSLSFDAMHALVHASTLHTRWSRKLSNYSDQKTSNLHAGLKIPKLVMIQIFVNTKHMKIFCSFTCSSMNYGHLAIYYL